MYRKGGGGGNEYNLWSSDIYVFVRQLGKITINMSEPPEQNGWACRIRAIVF